MRGSREFDSRQVIQYETDSSRKRMPRTKIEKILAHLPRRWVVSPVPKVALMKTQFLTTRNAPNRSCSRRLLFLGLSALAIHAANADTFRWSGGSSTDPNDFNDPDNWTYYLGGSPGSGDEAFFQVNATTNLSSDTTVGRVVLSAGSNVRDVTVDTNGNTLTLNLLSSATANAGTGSATLNLKGNVVFAASQPSIQARPNSRVVFDSGTLTSTASGSLPVSGGGIVELKSTAVGSGIGNVDVYVGTELNITGNSSIAGNLRLQGGTSLALGGTDTLSLTGDIYTILAPSTAADWVIDLAGASVNTSLINAADIDITNIDLDLSNVPSDTGTNVPYILATYSGTLTGDEFASISGLGHHQIVYDFGPSSNQIAIIPEVGHATPLLGGLLPLLMIRSRQRRGSAAAAM